MFCISKEENVYKIIKRIIKLLYKIKNFLSNYLKNESLLKEESYEIFSILFFNIVILKLVDEKINIKKCKEYKRSKYSMVV